MGGNGAYSSSAGVARAHQALGSVVFRQFASMNLDHDTYEFDIRGVQLKSKSEAYWAEREIVLHISLGDFDVGDVFVLPAETLPNGGACSYTVMVTGDTPLDYRIIGRERII